MASVSYAPVISPVGGEAFKDGKEYSLVAFSGTVLWAENREHNVTSQADGSVTSDFQISCFEYIGDKLSASISDIQSEITELDDKLSKISVTAAGGVQAVSDAAKSAGFEIESVVVEGVTTPTLDLTTATITDGNFASTTGNKDKLVTAADVESYVAKNAKVSVNGQEATTITVAGTPSTSDDIVKIVVTEDKDTTDKIGLTLTATIDEAVFDENGNLEQDGIVIASIAQNIADAAIDSAIKDTTNGAIAGAISDAIEDATLNSGDKGDNQIQNAANDAANKLVTAAQVKEYVEENAQVTVKVGTTEKTATGFEFAGSTGSDVSLSAAMDANGKVTYSATLHMASVDSTTGAITNDSGGLAVSATDADRIANAAIDAAITASDGAIAGAIDQGISDATATVGADGSVTEANKTKLVTAGDAQTIAQKAADAVDVGVTGVKFNGAAAQTGEVSINALTDVSQRGGDVNAGSVNISKDGTNVQLTANAPNITSSNVSAA